MLWKQIAFAATATAFLVVPEITEAEEDVYKALPVDVYTDDIPAHAMSQSIDMPCNKCRGKDTHLTMDFTVEDGTKLSLNGYELYPSADPWHGDLTAAVVKGNGKKKEQLLGYSLAIGPQSFDEQQHLEIVNIALHIIEVGGRFIEDLPTLGIKLIKAPTGEILIGDVNMQEAEPVQCTDVWCRVKHGWEQAWKEINSMKGCSKHKNHGHGHGHGGPKGSDRMQVDGKRPHHGHHGRPEYERNWGQLAKDLAVSIILPVLTGIVAGVGVAVFAMGICSLVALVFRSRRRRCRRSRRASKAAATEPALVEEKAGLMDDQEDDEDAPPQYQDEQPSDRV